MTDNWWPPAPTSWIDQKWVKTWTTFLKNDRPQFRFPEQLISDSRKWTETIQTRKLDQNNVENGQKRDKSNFLRKTRTGNYTMISTIWVQNWNIRFKTESWVQNWNIRFKTETLGSKLKHWVQNWNMGSKLKHWAQNWNIGSKPETWVLNWNMGSNWNIGSKLKHWGQN